DPFARLLVAAGSLASAIAVVGQSAGVRIALAVLLAAAATRAYARSRGSARRARLPALAAAFAFAAVLAAGGVVALAGAGGGADRAVLWAYDAVIVLVASVFALDLARGRWTEATGTSLVLDLGDGTQ